MGLSLFPCGYLKVPVLYFCLRKRFMCCTELRAIYPMTQGNSLKMNSNSKARDSRLQEPQSTNTTMTEGNSLKMNSNSKAEVSSYFLALPQKVTKKSRAEKPSSESYAAFRTFTPTRRASSDTGFTCPPF